MQIELDLGNPNLTLLHRAGLAGLWMTLKYFDNNSNEKRPEGLNWKITPRQIILQWERNDREILDNLLRESFQIQDGLIYFRCLNLKDINDIQPRLIIHQGMLGTFLQHNSTHKSTGIVEKTLQIDEDTPEILIKYKYLKSYVHQEFVNKLCDSQGKLLKKPIKIAGWLNPGAVVRHVAFSSQTSFEETPEQALMLLFAPIACCYFLLKSKLQEKKAQFALVIPEITNLEKYTEYRQRPSFKNAGYKSFYASSLGNAGLKFLVQKNSSKTAKTYGVNQCQVLTLGTVPWSTQQKTRTNLYIVKANEEICNLYRMVCNYFTDNILINQKNEGYFVSSFAKEFITDNLVKKRLWYEGLSDKITNNELFAKLTYERDGLNKMMKKGIDTEYKKLFIEAFHETLYNTYGQAGAGNKQPNFDKINVQIRTKLARCKNAESLRSFIFEFWSKPGTRSNVVKNNWKELMILITETDDWKLLRDLALLGLASYKSKSNYKQSDESIMDVQKEDDDDEIEI